MGCQELDCSNQEKGKVTNVKGNYTRFTEISNKLTMTSKLSSLLYLFIIELCPVSFNPSYLWKLIVFIIDAEMCSRSLPYRYIERCSAKTQNYVKPTITTEQESSMLCGQFEATELHSPSRYNAISATNEACICGKGLWFHHLFASYVLLL